MTTSNFIECDACGTRRQTDKAEPDSTPWLKVQTQMSPDEYQGIIEKLRAGASVDSLTDGGDFCSLICLANWASAQHSLKQLSDDNL